MKIQNMSTLFTTAAELEKQNIPFALANIIETRGIAPRHSAQMLIKADGSITGTIGGGMLERYVIEQAVEAVALGESRIVTGSMTSPGPQTLEINDGSAVRVLISVFGQRSHLVLVGAGHVSRAVARIAHTLGFTISVLDSHAPNLDATYFPPRSALIHHDDLAAGLDQMVIDRNSYVVVATNREERAAVHQLVGFDMRYLGILAGHTRTQKLFDYLRKQNVAQARIDAIHAPVGLDVGAETPEEIAVSVLAEILAVKNDASGQRMRRAGQAEGNKLVVIRGAGDMATGVAARLFNSGFRVIMTEVAQPTTIRHTVAFSQAIFNGITRVEDITARLAHGYDDALKIAAQNEVAVLVDPGCESLVTLQPHYVIDAILAKRNCGTRPNMAPVVVALGPGFSAPEDCHAVIETNRGHYLGNIIYHGSAQPNTGVPGNIAGYSRQRVIHAEAEGIMHTEVKLGDLVEQNDIVAYIDDVPVLSPLTGMVRGLLNNDLPVHTGMKIGDVDPRGAEADYTTISDKARAVAGAVLEAMLYLDRSNAL